MGAFGHFAALLAFSSTGYSPDVAANAAIGCGNPVNQRNSALITKIGSFLCL
ncbi:hypothetical protein OU5_4024 [Pseudomonas mandelii JR-1]|jgi:hypothetical protein|uniref:Uncharacterized protein n=1 Tax=Pseudomonas mandelii JR-1 TaxID=1147786 RepID=A0A024EFH8_9PSED|nr:hypothetical protein OU5_4024 [Pseudomonas mandelii JR-1]